jgi:general secretion pathway protein B
MSYLLKALEKAEKEREQQTLNETLLPTEVQVASRLPFGVIVFVVLVLSATLIKVFLSDSKNQLALNEDESANSIVKMVESKPIVQKSQPISQSLEPILISPDPAYASSNTVGTDPLKALAEPEAKEVASVVEESLNEPLELYALPKSMLAKIPSITLESHIFSSAAEFRSVVINGRTFKEGMMLNAEVVLSSITNKGVVLDVSGQKVSLDKGITWVAAKNAK